MIEDAALGCLISCGEDPSSDYEDLSGDDDDPNNYIEAQLNEDIFDPNKYDHNEDDSEVERIWKKMKSETYTTLFHMM